MNSIRVKYLCIILANIYLSGSVSSDGLNANVTLTATDNMKRNEEVRQGSVDNPPFLKNETCASPSEAVDVIRDSKSPAESEVLPSTTECYVGVESGATMTATYSDSYGNGTASPKALTLHHSDCVNLGIRETAGFVAIGFLAFSVIGYVGFVLWRRYLLNKYGNGQTLITEDVYDTSDLRHFEI